jgi:hypothetical protein
MSSATGQGIGSDSSSAGAGEVHQLHVTMSAQLGR